MAEYKEISSGLKMLLSKAEKMGWNWDAYIETDNRRTYVEIGQASPAGEDFSMIIDFKEKDQAKSFKENLQMYYEDFDVDEHIEMWIEARHNGISGVPSTRELVKDTYSFFVYADDDYREKEGREYYKGQSLDELKKRDQIRNEYYEKFTGIRRDDPHYYDMVINVSKTGAAGAAGLILDYIKNKEEKGGNAS